jgi:hypothetical protein
MKRFLLAVASLALAACASTPAAPPAPAQGAYSETMISANRWRVSYDAPASMSAKEIEARTLKRAARVTLDKGKEWFEIKDRAAGEHKLSLEIIMGSGETLAGGSARQYDARETLDGPSS